jgi:hypothetical protein
VPRHDADADGGRFGRRPKGRSITPVRPSRHELRFLMSGTLVERQTHHLMENLKASAEATVPVNACVG